MVNNLPRRYVCILSPGGLEHAGGIGRAMAYLIGEWSNKREPHEPEAMPVKVIDTRGGGPLIAAPFFLMWAILRILGLAAAGRLALVHVNIASRGSTVRKFFIVSICVAARIRFVMHLHGAMFQHFYRSLPRPAKTIVRWMFRRADRVIVLGEVWKRFAVDELGIVENRVDAISNGVPGPPAGPAKHDGPIHIVFLGRLGDRKGVPELLSALASQRLSVHAWKATLAGDGEISRFQAEAARLGIASRVAFPGWLGREEATTLLAGADIFVLPSHHEGLPVAVLEALAHGLATVATPVGSLPEFLVDGESVLFARPGDVDSLAIALERVVVSPAERRRLGEQARQVFRRHFDIRTTAASVQRIYETVCKPRTADAEEGKIALSTTPTER